MIHIHVGKGAGDRIISNREGRIFQLVYFFLLLFFVVAFSWRRNFKNAFVFKFSKKTIFF